MPHGGYTCQDDARELGYALHLETLASGRDDPAAVKCTGSDPVVYIDQVRLLYSPLDVAKAVNAPGYVKSLNSQFACLADAKVQGFHVADGLLMPADTTEKAVMIRCGTDVAWFTPAAQPTVYMRSTNPHYAEGSGAYSCGSWAPVLGAQPATPDDAKIPPPFSCNRVAVDDVNPQRFLEINYAASGIGATCRYDLDRTSIDPSPITACDKPSNAYTFSSNGHKDVLRVALMVNGGVLFRGWGYGTKAQVRRQLLLPQGNVAVLCLLGKKMAGQ